MQEGKSCRAQAAPAPLLHTSKLVAKHHPLNTMALSMKLSRNATARQAGRCVFRAELESLERSAAALASGALTERDLEAVRLVLNCPSSTPHTHTHHTQPRDRGEGRQGRFRCWRRGRGYGRVADRRREFGVHPGAELDAMRVCWLLGGGRRSRLLAGVRESSRSMGLRAQQN